MTVPVIDPATLTEAQRNRYYCESYWCCPNSVSDYLSKNCCFKICQNRIPEGTIKTGNNMKTELTIEESQRLIELGVSADKASKEVAVTINEEEYNDRKHPLFTLNDLLCIIPKWIKYRNMLLWLNIRIDEYEEKWCAAYRGGTYDSDEADTFQSAYELVDCLALLLEELIKQNLLNNK